MYQIGFVPHDDRDVFPSFVFGQRISFATAYKVRRLTLHVARVPDNVGHAPFRQPRDIRRERRPDAQVSFHGKGAVDVPNADIAEHQTWSTFTYPDASLSSK